VAILGKVEAKEQVQRLAGAFAVNIQHGHFDGAFRGRIAGGKVLQVLAYGAGISFERIGIYLADKVLDRI
jgi:hypothetical protein